MASRVNGQQVLQLKNLAIVAMVAGMAVFAFLIYDGPTEADARRQWEQRKEERRRAIWAAFEAAHMQRDTAVIAAPLADADLDKVMEARRSVRRELIGARMDIQRFAAPADPAARSVERSASTGSIWNNGNAGQKERTRRLKRLSRQWRSLRRSELEIRKEIAF